MTTTQRDMTVWKDRFVFPSLIEGYIKGLGPKFTERTKARLKAGGLDVDKLPPAIPAVDMEKYTRIFASEAWPDEPEVEQLRMLGLSAIRGWQTGMLGKAATAMLRLIGIERSITRLDRAFSTTNNFSKARSVLVNKNEALITVNELQDIPSYWIGIFEAALELLGREGTVVLESRNGPEGVFRVTWK
ncbi:MAG: DUF2378 family protein [Archangium sp.]